MKPDNHIEIEMDSLSQNESFARVAAAAFVSHVDPLMSDIVEIKTAVSEAVTNAIIHGYEDQIGKIYISLTMRDSAAENELTIVVKDNGVGIQDISQAMEPLYTSKAYMERSGMGFTIMESFMDSIVVQSEEGKGTVVTMTKKLSRT